MATFGDLKHFVERDGWTEEPNLVRGRRRTGDHRRYRKDLADGDVFRTKVSHSLRDEIGGDLFRHILRDQLHVTEERFWAVVRGRSSASSERTTLEPARTPAWLVQRLIFTCGIPEEQIRRMTVEEALAAWESCRSRPK